MQGETLNTAHDEKMSHKHYLLECKLREGRNWVYCMQVLNQYLLDVG